MRIVLSASGVVMMYSANGQPTPDVGQTALDLSSDQETAFIAALALSPRGVTFDGKTFVALPAPIPPPPPTVDQKLAAIGLTITDIQGAIVEAQTKSPVPIPDPNTAPAP